MRLPLVLSVGAHGFLALLIVGATLWPEGGPRIPPVIAEVELIVRQTPKVARVPAVQPAPPARPSPPSERPTVPETARSSSEVPANASKRGRFASRASLRSEPDARPLPVPPPPPSHSPPRPARHAAQPRHPTAQQSAELRPEPSGAPEGAGTGLVSGPAIVPAAVDAGVQNVPPAYPRRAVRLGEQGSVLLEIDVAADGHASAVRVATSSGYPILDHAARQAVTRWHFMAARRAGVTVPSTLRLRIRFELKGPNSDEP